jgi:Spy/CpxP family protein refolding chaperone
MNHRVARHVGLVLAMTMSAARPGLAVRPEGPRDQLACGSGAAPARAPMGMPPLEHVLERHAVEIGLTEATMAEIGRLADASRQAVEEARNESRQARDALRKLVLDPEASDAELTDAAAAVGETEARLASARALTDHRLLALITSDQRARLTIRRPSPASERGPGRSGPPRRQ